MCERSLLAEVIEQAVRDADYGQDGHQRSATRWLRSKSEGAWSFRWMCDHLGIDPDVVLARLEQIEFRAFPTRAQ